MRSERFPTIAAAILAGGKATRYGGAAKGLLRLPDGTTIVERLLQVLARADISDIVICANDSVPYAHLGLRIIPDAVADAGPLGGIAAALRHFAGNPHPSFPSPSLERGCPKDRGETGRYDGVLVVPCDMPAISEREIGALVAAFAGRVAQASACQACASVMQAKACGTAQACATAPLVVAATGGGEMQPLCAVLRTDVLDAVLGALASPDRGVGRLWRKLGAGIVMFSDPAPFVNVNTPADLAAWIEANRV